MIIVLRYCRSICVHFKFSNHWLGYMSKDDMDDSNIHLKFMLGSFLRLILVVIVRLFVLLRKLFKHTEQTRGEVGRLSSYHINVG